MASDTPGSGDDEGDGDESGSYQGDGDDSDSANGSVNGSIGDVGESDDDSFKPPGFLEAMKTTFRPNGPRVKAQPATGTDADAQAVNYIDKRERMIAAFLAAFQIILGIVIYFQYRRELVRPSTKSPKISVTQAHLDTLNYHHEAPELLAVNLLLGMFIVGGVFSKRRALVGFTLMLGGLGLNASGGGLIGLAYLGVGIWLVFRSMRRNPSARAAAAAKKDAGKGGGGAGTRGGGRAATKASSKSAEALAARKPPPPSKRYTPPRTRRPVPVKVPVSAEPEKESRLTSWLRR